MEKDDPAMHTTRTIDYLVVLSGEIDLELDEGEVHLILVHRALEAVNAFGEDLEETIHDAVPLLRVELGGQFRRSPDVGEQDGDLLALAFKGPPGGEDFLDEMLRRVRERIRWWPRFRGLSELLCAFSAEKLPRLILCSA